MEARNPLARRLFTLAYAQPQALPKRRTKPSQTPGWFFDVTVVVLLVISIVAYFTV